MNGVSPDIQVVRPFTEAVDLTKLILFRPFDLKKWFVMGFAAWLSHIGVGFNFNFRSSQRAEIRELPAIRNLSDTFHHMPMWLVVTVVAFLIIMILTLAVVFAWLRARGAFMFTDNIVRNQAAIAEPWREFRKLGNSLFLFSLIIGIGFLVIAAVLAIPSVVLFLRGRQLHHHPGALLITTAVLWAAMLFVFVIAWALIKNLMVPIMYRRRCLAGEGFRAALSLINTYPGEITLYCLFWILIAIGSVIAACVVVCLTCCVAAIPYLGTVILLPIYVCVRAFGLLFLRQFGPDYDVWAGLPEPAPFTASPSPPPV